MPSRAVAFAVLLGLAAPSAARAEVRLSMHDGVVSLVAEDATVAQILAEWARVGQTTIVNGEKVPGGTVSLRMVDMPEEQALDILLRTVSGFLAAPRQAMTANLSRFDRILIMPTPVSALPRGGAPAPTFPPARRQPPSDTPDPDNVVSADDELLPNAPPPAPPIVQRGPAGTPNTFPMPIAPPADDSMPMPMPNPMPYTGPTPSIPAGVATPGMIVQPPRPAAPAPPAP